MGRSSAALTRWERVKAGVEALHFRSDSDACQLCDRGKVTLSLSLSFPTHEMGIIKPVLLLLGTGQDPARREGEARALEIVAMPHEGTVGWGGFVARGLWWEPRFETRSVPFRAV